MTPTHTTTKSESFAARAAALGIESHLVDGLDPFAVQDAVARAAETCRRGDGPVLLECSTVRLKGHYNKDIEHYRPRADREAAAAADPIVRLSALALERGVLTQEDIDAIERVAQDVVDAATDEVRAMSLPDPARCTVISTGSLRLSIPAMACSKPPN